MAKIQRQQTDGKLRERNWSVEITIINVHISAFVSIQFSLLLITSFCGWTEKTEIQTNESSLHQFRFVYRLLFQWNEQRTTTRQWEIDWRRFTLYFDCKHFGQTCTHWSIRTYTEATTTSHRQPKTENDFFFRRFTLSRFDVYFFCFFLFCLPPFFLVIGGYLIGSWSRAQVGQSTRQRLNVEMDRHFFCFCSIVSVFLCVICMYVCARVHIIWRCFIFSPLMLSISVQFRWTLCATLKCINYYSFRFMCVVIKTVKHTNSCWMTAQPNERNRPYCDELLFIHWHNRIVNQSYNLWIILVQLSPHEYESI